MNKQHCQFCKIIKQKPNLVIYEDDQLFAFHDINKASAVEHILVCPKQHIQSVDNVIDSQLIIKMKDVGIKLLQGLNKGNKFRFGFHKNKQISIFHLHLHCFIQPITSFVQDKIQYGYMLHGTSKIIKQIKQKSKL